MKTLMLLALIAFPAAARADLVFRCRTTGADELSVNLRFDERGKSGRLEVDRWTNYPPTPLVYADLKALGAKEGRAQYSSEVDPNSGARAELGLPLSFLKEGDFTGTLTLIQVARSSPFPLACERF